MDEPDMTTKEVADLLRVTKVTVTRWIEAGEFPGAYKAGPSKSSPYRIPRQSVNAFIAKLRGDAEKGMPASRVGVVFDLAA